MAAAQSNPYADWELVYVAEKQRSTEHRASVAHLQHADLSEPEHQRLRVQRKRQRARAAHYHAALAGRGK